MNDGTCPLCKVAYKANISKAEIWCSACDRFTRKVGTTMSKHHDDNMDALSDLANQRKAAKAATVPRVASSLDDLRVLERFHAKVIENEYGCWQWHGAMSHNGYGQFWDGTKTVRAHRWSYEWYVAPIPQGLTIDHLCRNPACVKPTHLEAVTIRENVLRGEGPSALNAVKDHCHSGHEFTPENTYMRANGGGRACRACWAENTKAYAERRAERIPCEACGTLIGRSNMAKHQKRCEVVRQGEA